MQTETTITCVSLVRSLVTAFKSFIALLPFPDETKNGAVKRFDTVLSAVLNAQQHRCDWSKCDSAWTTLRSEFGAANVETLVRFMLKADVSPSEIGMRIGPVFDKANKVLEHPDAKATIIGKDDGEQFAGMVATDIARGAKDPAFFLKLVRSSR